MQFVDCVCVVLSLFVGCLLHQHASLVPAYTQRAAISTKCACKCPLRGRVLLIVDNTMAVTLLLRPRCACR